MSTLGTRIACGRFARLLRSAHARQRDHAAEATRAEAPSAEAPARMSRKSGNRFSDKDMRKIEEADTPYWLLWSTSAVAFVLGVIAFVLWGLNGAGTLFDMIVALCT
jgi:hypothetical protein